MSDSQGLLVITGFMGTGKTRVGQMVAQRLGWPFVDMDDVIEEREGRSIAQIFAQEGEGYFRQKERQLCAELASHDGLVVATGGGCLIDDENRRRMLEAGVVVCLDCAAEEIVDRVSGHNDRPLLAVEDRAARVHNLLAARRAAYGRIPHHVNTTERTPAQVAEAVLRILEGHPGRLEVRTPGGSYPVHVISNGLRQVGYLLAATEVGERVALVSDSNVWPLYGEIVAGALRDEGYHPIEIVVPAGEEHKRLDTVRDLYDRFVAGELDRGGAVLALGGGVLTDMAGFAAASYMRGVPLVQLPTTLLGMVDASVGGKVAVDHPKGKNLIGAFVEPLFVLLDPTVLQTLSETAYRSGLAEIIKAGVIADEELFAAFEGERLPDVRWLIARALQVKIDVVEEDPYEHGRRAVLNLGHTFAHAFEVLEDYKLAHGLAVSIGMAVAARLAEDAGLCSPATAKRIISALQRHDLPVRYADHDPGAVYRAMWADKKRRGDRLRLILPRAVGDVVIVDDLEEAQILSAIERSKA